MIRPSSKLIGRVLKVMQEIGYINQFEFIEDGKAGVFKVKIEGKDQQLRRYQAKVLGKKTDLEKYEARYLPAQDFGVLILTTTEGVISHVQARELGVGGKLLAFVY